MTEDEVNDTKVIADLVLTGDAATNSCSPTDKEINPIAADICDTKDNDCDGTPDNDPIYQIQFYSDDDNDNWADVS